MSQKPYGVVFQLLSVPINERYLIKLSFFNSNYKYTDGRLNTIDLLAHIFKKKNFLRSLSFDVPECIKGVL
jgi:hypothetical protein